MAPLRTANLEQPQSPVIQQIDAVIAATVLAQQRSARHWDYAELCESN